MTISEIKTLVEKTRDLTIDEMVKIANMLSLFDCCNYVVWMKQLYNITIPI